MDLTDKKIVLIGGAGLVGSHIVDQLLSEPVGYLDVVQLEKSARMILTDSGGIQKEAYWLSVPCGTLREETEWTETAKAGRNMLVGADMEQTVRAVRSFKPPVTHQVLYKDKKNGERIRQAFATAG